MATRRPPSSRSRIPAGPPSTTNATRSRTAAPKQAATQQHPTPIDVGQSTGSSRSQPEPAATTNIQVVIRCRNRSDREVQENSPIIVNSAGAKSKDVSIETGAPVSSLGVVTSAPTRTYPFDCVFGPEADQAMIYHEVVSPMLDQVLQGYNCTLFAYGQTGTGKTYTMQGDLSRTPMGNPSNNAGMIPRVLFRLFHQLDTAGADYSVKISYVELYNEELRDLLASDLSAPTGSTQPMGMSGKDKGGDNGLKIFDEAGKKGVFIQGLEEIAVKDSRDALALLTKGSERRQIAATNFNEHSSRSHSVFSITVHLKDVSFGEDLLKTGKLHLVDLAGSENIGRSGAENKRAREAGMINQSLLTLGRVINALVDKASHVPYRESKLTRLLQDSLGGRTKTCIIATISPARSNMEETLSTLDYALRAKSIRNKPEINQRMTRNALIKEYVAEIDRLKADLLAAREKNGIFLSEERVKEMEVEQEMQRTELMEARKKVDIVEGQLRNVREEYDQSIGLLTQREDELKETNSHLSKTREELELGKRELEATQVALQEEELVRQAYQDSERNLNGIAENLRSTVAQSTREVEALQAKLDRKAGVMTSNKRAVTKYGKETISSADLVATSIDSYVTSVDSLHTGLTAKANSLLSAEGEALSDSLQQLEQRDESSRAVYEQIRGDDETETRLFSALEQDLRDAHSNFELQLTTWRTTVQEAVQLSCGKIGTAIENHSVVVEQSVDALQAALEDIVRNAKQYLQEQRVLLAELKGASDTQAAAEIQRLKEENELLGRIIDHERSQSEKSKDHLIERISGLLGAFLDERHVSLRDAIGGVQQTNDRAVNASSSYFGEQDQRMGVVAEKSKVFEGSLGLAAREGKRKREAVGEVVRSTHEVLNTNLGELQGATNQKIQGVSVNVLQHQQRVTTVVTSSLAEHSRIKRARIEKIDGLESALESDHGFMQSTLESRYQNLADFASNVTTDVSSLAKLAAQHSEIARRNVQSLQKTANAILEKGTKDDPSTGETPQKRSWSFIEQWDLAESRDEILADFWRQNNPTPVASSSGSRPASRTMSAGSGSRPASRTMPEPSSAGMSRGPPSASTSRSGTPCSLFDSTASVPPLQRKRVLSGPENLTPSPPLMSMGPPALPAPAPVMKMVDQVAPPPSRPSIPFPSSKPTRETRRTANAATETLAESRKRNVSTRSRRQMGM